MSSKDHGQAAAELSKLAKLGTLGDFKSYAESSLKADEIANTTDVAVTAKLQFMGLGSHGFMLRSSLQHHIQAGHDDQRQHRGANHTTDDRTRKRRVGAGSAQPNRHR